MRPELESIYETAPVGLAVLDSDLRFLRINERLAEMNGLPVEAHLGRSVQELFPDVAAQAAPMLRRVLESGEALHDVELRGETPAQPGRQRVWLEHFTPLHDESGRVVRISVVAEEVTERRHAEAVQAQAEQALRESRETLSLAMQAAGQAPWRWDVSNDRFSFGPGWTALLGEEPGKTIVTWREWLDRVEPADQAGLRDRALAHLEGRAPTIEAEFRIRHADGRWRWLSTLGRGVERDVQGRPRTVMGVTSDVTEQRQAREQLEDRARLLGLAFDAVFVWSPDGGIEFWNHGAEHQYGYTAQEALGKNPSQLLHTTSDASQDDRREVLARDGLWKGDLSHTTKDGRRLTVTAVMQSVADGHARILEITRDITERRAFEQALQEADTRRTEFLAMLAHELRNPLAPIKNAVRILERADHDPDRRESATRILRRQTDHLARLVDDLLEASRVTRGRIDLRMERVLVANAIHQAVEAARPLAQERNQVLTVDVAPATHLVADPVRLTQIVSNLLTNAVKYTGEGGHIDVSTQAEGDDWISIIVRDDGVGIPADMQQKIFELFTQVESTLDRSHGGLGIGLALVKRLAEMHGGHVRCESGGPGTGARFVVCLPLQARRGQAECSQATGGGAGLPPLSVLVVEDNADAAETLATLLRLDGHRVDVVHDGQRALAAAYTDRPRVVLLDLGLPVIDGLELSRRLRADPKFDRTALVAMSGYAQPEDRAKSAAAGIDVHVSKPADISTIYQAVEQALKARQGLREAAAA
jgi:PAS domain S-box-containing protein